MGPPFRCLPRCSCSRCFAWAELKKPEEVSVPLHQPAILVLADGTVLRGVSIGAEGCAVGEVVFNTAMTGYQEI
ncbi:MAG TPA: hypothetical protein DEP05_05785, partial [Betaproteobacteria bacterium]|nr:hypothetical protein [Betaproteobacteria bacterium]